MLALFEAAKMAASIRCSVLVNECVNECYEALITRIAFTNGRNKFLRLDRHMHHAGKNGE